MALFETFLPCGVLGEACPTNVWFDYFPETDTESEHIVLQQVLVEVPTKRATEKTVFDYQEFNVLHDLTQAQKNNIEEAYLDKLHSDGCTTYPDGSKTHSDGTVTAKGDFSPTCEICKKLKGIS